MRVPGAPLTSLTTTLLPCPVSRYGPAGSAYDPAAAAAANGYMVPPGAMYTMPYAAEVGLCMFEQTLAANGMFT
eukprot:786700-Pelagomonas_calceolata.AAC.2